MVIGDSRVHHSRFRWCNIIDRTAATQSKSTRSVTRVVSSMPLWAGPSGAEHWCTCRFDRHASAKDIVGGVKNAKLRDQCWAEVAHYLIALAISGTPLTPRTRRWGARPELHLRCHRELHSAELGFAQKRTETDGRKREAHDQKAATNEDVGDWLARRFHW